jgi:SPP1 family predicted phage head-tail adaptor
MRAGRLNCRVRIERQMEVKSPSGGVSISWVELGTFWAEIDPISGKEYFAASQLRAEVDTKITMRFQPGITFKDTDRAVYGDDVYSIYAPLDKNTRHEMLFLMCKKNKVRDGR